MKQFIRLYVSLFLLLVLGAGAVTAQSVMSNDRLITVTGKVVSVTDDEPIIGASVVVRDTRYGSATDLEGNFTIRVPKGSTLVITYVGYDEAQVVANDSLKIACLIPSKEKSGWIYLSSNPSPENQACIIIADVNSPDAIPLKE